MRPGSPLYHAKHIVRAGLLLVVGVVALVLGRFLFVPESWGRYGAYRANDVPTQMAKPLRHGGSLSCRECHPDIFDEVRANQHAGLACEGCHAPLAEHVRDGDWVAEMPVRRSADLCLLCHQQLDARPGTHPQIQPRLHLEEQGASPEDACLDCHGSHTPL